MALYCVDASFVVAGLVPEQRSAAIDGRWNSYALGADEFVGPPFLNAETLSALRKLATRGLLAAVEERAIVQDFLDLAIPTQAPVRLYHRAHLLAVRYRQPTVYDCCYLALADFPACPLLTLDERFQQAVAEDFPFVELVA